MLHTTPHEQRPILDIVAECFPTDDTTCLLAENLGKVVLALSAVCVDMDTAVSEISDNFMDAVLGYGEKSTADVSATESIAR